jgi:hypothetical protein
VLFLALIGITEKAGNGTQGSDLLRAGGLIREEPYPRVWSAILLEKRHPQTRKTVAINHLLPRLKFVERQVISLASLISGEQPLAESRNNRRFAPDDPPSRIGRWQTVHGEFAELVRQPKRICLHARGIPV